MPDVETLQPTPDFSAIAQQWAQERQPAASDDGTVHPPMLMGPSSDSNGNPVLATIPNSDSFPKQCTADGQQCPVPITPHDDGTNHPPMQMPSSANQDDPPSAGAEPPPATCSDPNPLMRPITCTEQPDPNPVHEAQVAEVWDVATGAIPGASYVAMAADGAKALRALANGDTEQAKQDASDTALDYVGSIPGAGQILSVEEYMWDADAEEERKHGKTAEQAPTFSQAWYKGLPSWKDITSPFTDPESWTPKGPEE